MGRRLWIVIFWGLIFIKNFLVNAYRMGKSFFYVEVGGNKFGRFVSVGYE